MQNSRLCDAQAVANCVKRQSSRAILRAGGAAESSDRFARRSKDVAQKFAELFYSMLFTQMQKTVPYDESSSSIAEGARGLVTRYLPRAVAGGQGDPLTNYFRENFPSSPGEGLDEKI